MAKKNFKNTLGEKKFLTVLNSAENQPKNEETKASTKASKTTKTADKLAYKPRTLKIREDVLEACQALAWWNRKSVQSFFTEVLEAHIESIDARELKEILDKYKKK